MIITSLKISAFGKFINKTINFSDGLNIIYGENEAGKSTTHAFIKAMLFGFDKKKNKVSTDSYQKYYPWDSQNKYGGSLTFIYANCTYEIEREFSITEPKLEIRNLSEGGITVDDPDLFLNKVLHNISRDTFDNTISVRQLKSAQNSSMIDELHQIISNLNTSGDMSIDTLYALNLLSHKKEKLQQSKDKEATIIYNRQLGNIRNLEKKLSNQKYDNKLPELISKKNADEKRINANTNEIENLKKIVADNNLILNQYGFKERKDIDALSNEASKIYLDYKPILKNRNYAFSFICNVFFMLIGIAMIVFSSLMLVATYPSLANTLRLHDTRYSMNFITNFIVNLPFHPIVLIGILICVGLILLIGNIILLINNMKSRSVSTELHDILSDIFTEHINTDEVSEENMLKFKKHIRDMRTIAKTIMDSEAKMISLTDENNELIERQSEYAETIKLQQKIQYDVESKYTELNNLRIENKKIEHILETNDHINNEIESISLAIETIKSLSNEIKVSFGTHLNNTASKYISILTNNKYKSINVDNSLSVTINYEGRFMPLSQASIGTIDQIYLALRLAIADIINSNDNILPLIFDDCFAMYDNNRLEATLRFLSSLNSQILVFTCHTRENDISSHNSIKANSFCINN